MVWRARNRVRRTSELRVGTIYRFFPTHFPRSPDLLCPPPPWRRAGGPPDVVAARGLPNPEGPSGGVVIPSSPSTPADPTCGGGGQIHQWRRLEAELAARAVPDCPCGRRWRLGVLQCCCLIACVPAVRPCGAASERECGTPVCRRAQADSRRTRT
ncbi:hypothetical protein GQ55_1G043300 [Panicum hallii var. hallii]|uniref:Uncharacterized protein n=1 Tax=Panicum hallii var. hallii TaxID=1504633 RepID=A0A2T7F253_9POAL|nr:hypothetical protein GQ55_1G043300 [Panicum hallii var. hallii]